jgi:CheY-like chemotaxis protein
MLAFSRRQPLQPDAISLNKFISSLTNAILATLNGSAELNVDLPADLWQIAVDGDELEKALLNLADNAHDAMPNGGRLTIAAQNATIDEASVAHPDMKPGCYVLLSVTDTGAGMPQAVLEQAFEPFFTTKPVGRGTGLGLSQALGFAKQSGGQIQIESTQGHGTRVLLHLPATIEAAVVEKPPVAINLEPVARQGEVVLIVDDEAMVRKQVTTFLTKLGYQTVEAEDGAAGRAVLASAVRIDLLLTDVIMPNDIDGAELAREALLQRSDLKVLFMSGYTRNALIQDGVIDPTVDLLTKPFRRSELAQKVREVLDTRGDSEASSSRRKCQ